MIYPKYFEGGRLNTIIRFQGIFSVFKEIKKKENKVNQKRTKKMMLTSDTEDSST